MPNHHRKSLPSNVKPLVSAIATCLALSAMPSQAAIITVTNTSDNDAGSLRQAIITANAGGMPDTIDFAAGLDGQTITLSSGQMHITDTAPLIIDASALATGITISGNNTSRIFGETRGQKLTLNNLTVTSGSTTANTVISLNCEQPNSFTRGGAICAEGELELIDSTVSNSSTTGSLAHGGGFYAYRATLTNSTVSGNSTGGLNSYGGGFFANSSATLTNSTVSGNSTAGDNGWGGGFSAAGTATLTNSTVSGNSTTGSSAYGGGFSSFDTTTLTNSTVSGNSTAGVNSAGGGLFVQANHTLTNSTITQNITSYAGALGDGIATVAITTLNSTILSGNGTDNLASAGTVNSTNSLFGDDSGEVNGTNTANVFNNSPGLTALGDNGCATLAGAPAPAACVQTHALLTSSPALDVGTDNGLATDQRGAGFPRTINGFTDIGAYEGFAPPPPAPPAPIPTISVWGLGILAGLLGLMGFVRRRKT